MPEYLPRLRSNVEQVRLRMQQACERAGRNPDSVRLVAVTKYARIEWVQALVQELGFTDLAENRPQQLLARAALLPATVTWHLIGHLQSNKARAMLGAVRWIHSIDSFKLLTTLDRLAVDLREPPRVLLEVNVSGEASKDGFNAAQLETGWEAVLACRRLDICGLMTMAPLSADPEAARPTFRGLRELRDRLTTQSAGRLALPELSMGMTGDFEVAIEEGATLIRVGSALFEGLADAC